MFKKIILTVVTAFTMALLLDASSAREIIEKSEALPKPDSMRSLTEMTIKKGNNTLRRNIQLLSLSSGKVEKVLATVREEPSGLETKVLTHARQGREDLQWLKMANGRVKRITSADKSGEFVNSHFFYEDLGSRSINDFTYKLLGEERVESHRCYKIEAVPQSGKSIYEKVHLYIVKSGQFSYFTVRADIFYEGYLYKRLINHEFRIHDGIITPYRSVMYRLDRSGKHLGNTEMKVTALEYNNKKITDAMFNQDRL